MQIKKVRIKNYCSIRDSGDIFIEEKVTCLAGKNESGKTAILHALADFDQAKEIRAEAKPIEFKTLPEIAITFHVSGKQMAETLKAIGIKSQENQDFNIELVKVYPSEYSLSKATLDSFTNIKEAHSQSLNDSIKKILIDLQQPLRDNIDVAQGVPTIQTGSDQESVKTLINNFIDEVKPKIDALGTDKKTINISQMIDRLKKIVLELKTESEFVVDITKVIIKLIPTFIYFDSFDSLLPYELPLNQVETKQAAKDFFAVAGIDLVFLTNPVTTLQDKRNDLAGKSTVITGDFLDYWDQDKVELKASLDADKIIFGFVESAKSQEFTMEQRSRGFQWFLSFYMQLKLHQGSRDKYLLIDEPGLYLHAKAQEDVLKILEARSIDIPIIFSTHSPYLITYDKLYRVKLVYKTKETGTIVESKYHKISDKETLRPILTAIGLELTSGITNPDKLNNIVVEGPSDWYYLTAFKKILATENLNFIYGGGGGNMPHVGTILHGWGCKVLYLYDNDQGKKDGEKNLLDNWQVGKEQIKAISKEKTAPAIEDLFTNEDFRKLVLNDDSIQYAVSNSEHMKDKDKVIKAKQFLANVDTNINEISKETKEKFGSVMEELRKEFQ